MALKCFRSANDNLSCHVLRLDLKSEYETSEEIFTIMNLTSNLICLMRGNNYKSSCLDFERIEAMKELYLKVNEAVGWDNGRLRL